MIRNATRMKFCEDVSNRLAIIIFFLFRYPKGPCGHYMGGGGDNNNNFRHLDKRNSQRKATDNILEVT